MNVKRNGGYVNRVNTQLLRDARALKRHVNALEREIAQLKREARKREKDMSELEKKQEEFVKRLEKMRDKFIEEFVDDLLNHPLRALARINVTDVLFERMDENARRMLEQPMYIPLGILVGIKHIIQLAFSPILKVYCYLKLRAALKQDMKLFDTKGGSNDEQGHTAA